MEGRGMHRWSVGIVVVALVGAALLAGESIARKRPIVSCEPGQLAEALRAVEAAVPCASAKNHPRCVRKARRAFTKQLAKPCRKQKTTKRFMTLFLARSTCGTENRIV